MLFPCSSVSTGLVLGVSAFGLIRFVLLFVSICPWLSVILCTHLREDAYTDEVLFYSTCGCDVGCTHVRMFICSFLFRWILLVGITLSVCDSICTDGDGSV